MSNELVYRSDIELEERAWHSTFNYFLSDWDSDMEVADVIDAIKRGDESVLVWEPFELDEFEDLFAKMQIMQMSILEDLSWARGEGK